jgi:outer membrane protein assembly factor BamB
MEHLWTSTIDGVLGDESSIEVDADDLSIGAHLIRYCVRVDDGLWSRNSTSLLIVRPEPSDDWTHYFNDLNNSGHGSAGAIPFPTPEWEFEINGSLELSLFSQPTIVGDRLYYVAVNAAGALDLKTGEQIWVERIDWGADFLTSPAVSVEHNVMAVHGDELFVFDLDDGEVIWHKDLGFRNGGETGSPAISGDRLFIHNLNDAENVSCYDLMSGNHLWSLDLRQAFHANSPAVGFDRVYMVTLSKNDDNEGYLAIYALEEDSGDMDWRYRMHFEPGGITIPGITNVGVWDSPTLYEMDGQGYVVVGDLSGYVRAYEPYGEQPRDLIDDDLSGPDPISGAQDDGEVIWETELNSAYYPYNAVLRTSYHDGRIYLSTYFGWVYCLDAEDGSIIWENELKTILQQGVSVSDDAVYAVGTLDMFLYSLSLEDGSVNWKYRNRPWTSLGNPPAIARGSLFLPEAGGAGFQWRGNMTRLSPFVDVPEPSVSAGFPHSISLPEDGEWATVKVGVRNDGTGPSDARVALYHGNEAWENLIGYQWTSIAPGTVRGLSFKWNTTGMDGLQELTLRVIDPKDPVPDNNMARLEFFILKPWTTPIAIIEELSPNPAERTNSTEIRFSASGVAFGGIAEYLWNLSGEFLSDEQWFVMSVEAIDLGIYNISLVVRSSEGLWSEPVHRDLTVTGPEGRPIAEIVEVSPDPAKPYDVITLSGSGRSHLSIDDHEWAFDGRVLGTQARIEVDGDEFDGPGEKTIEFMVQDAEGTWSDPVTYVLTVLEQEPPIVEITSHDDDDPVSESILVEGTAGGERPIEKVEISIDGGLWEICNDGTGDWSEWSFIWNTTEVDNGEVVIGVKAKDIDGYEDTDEISVIIDNEEPVEQEYPSLSITSPKDGSGPYPFEIMVKGTSSDTDGYVVTIEMAIDDPNFDDRETYDGDDFWTIPLNVSHLDLGLHEIRLRAVDDDGLTSPEDSIEILVDNRRPVAVIEKIEPEAPCEDENIRLIGYGTNGDIVDYRWVSDIDGSLGSDAQIDLFPWILNVGDHVIIFRVQGTNGLWSRADTEILTVYEAQNDGGPVVVIDDPDDEDDLIGSILKYQYLILLLIPIVIALLVTARRTSAGPVEVEAIDDSSIWGQVTPYPDYFLLCPSCRDPSTYYPQYGRHYCHTCEHYLSAERPQAPYT